MSFSQKIHHVPSMHSKTCGDRSIVTPAMRLWKTNPRRMVILSSSSYILLLILSPRTPSTPFESKKPMVTGLLWDPLSTSAESVWELSIHVSPPQLLLCSTYLKKHLLKHIPRQNHMTPPRNEKPRMVTIDVEHNHLYPFITLFLL